MFRSDLVEKLAGTFSGIFYRKTVLSNEKIPQNSDLMEGINEENGFIFTATDDNSNSQFYIPEEILAHILSYVDFADLVFRCRLVCHSWRNVIEDFALRQKGERECALGLRHAVIRRDDKKLILPWYVYYLICYKNVFGRNLLKNNCGQNKFKHWEILSNGGNRFRIEKIPAGAEPLPGDDDFGGYNSCFATSYHSNSKVQIIDLSKEGFGSKIMDEIQPVIKISEWFAGRYDCGCIYELKVALLDKSKKPIVDFEQRESIDQWTGSNWKKIEHEFSAYGPGVRFISFYHGGMDRQFWAGHYGSKMAGGVVKLSYDPLLK